MFYNTVIKKILDNILQNILGDNFKKNKKDFSIELSVNEKHGDLATNAAMVYSKVSQTSPIVLAKKIKEHLLKEQIINNVEILKPGFINIFFNFDFWHQQLLRNFSSGILKKTKKINKKINIEFVSANPTGLMHIGHARGAVLGDAIASIMEFHGYDVTREYYVNDAGNQINILFNTVKFYFENLRKKKNLENINKKDLYPGEYIKNISTSLYNKIPNLDFIINKDKTKSIIVKIILNDIKQDLLKLGIQHDLFVSEKEITSSKELDSLVEKLKKKNLVYEGFQETPKGAKQSEWKSQKQLLFKSKQLGDDSDRALIKNNGDITYFMSDIIYHSIKVSKGYKVLVNIWGIDHSGYVKRLKNALSCLYDSLPDFNIKLTSLVNLIKDKKPIKMSKREGVYVTLRDVINEVGSDPLRYMMISRSPEKSIDFDFDLIKSKSKENPVFYIQYAHARCFSIKKTAIELIDYKFDINDLNLELLNLKEELKLIKILSSFTHILEKSADNYEPHRLTNYLLDLSKNFHNYWSLGNLNSKYRILNVEDLEISKARLFLVENIKKNLLNGLNILKINAPNSM